MNTWRRLMEWAEQHEQRQHAGHDDPAVMPAAKHADPGPRACSCLAAR